MSGLEAFLTSNTTAGGLVAAIVIMVLLGGLIPRWVMTQMRKDRDTRLAEAREEINDWRDAAKTSEAARALQAQQVGELLELAKTTDAFIRSLQVLLAAKRSET